MIMDLYSLNPCCSGSTVYREKREEKKKREGDRKWRERTGMRGRQRQRENTTNILSKKYMHRTKEQILMIMMEYQTGNKLEISLIKKNYFK